MTSPVASLIRQALLQYREPPRQQSFAEVLRAILKVKSMKTILLVSLSFAVASFALSILGRPSDRIPLSVCGFFSLLLSTIPLFEARRLVRMIRFGRLSLAVVEYVVYSGPGSRDTLDSIENGIARGIWRLPEGKILKFEVDEPWAKSLAVGTQVELLVAGNAASVFPLGQRQ